MPVAVAPTQVAAEAVTSNPNLRASDASGASHGGRPQSALAGTAMALTASAATPSPAIAIKRDPTDPFDFCKEWTALDLVPYASPHWGETRMTSLREPNQTGGRGAANYSLSNAWDHARQRLARLELTLIQ
jgi:hypothetical protein